MLAACSGPVAPITDVRIVDRWSGAVPGVRIEREKLEAEAKKVAERWPGFAVRPAKRTERGWQLTLEIEALGERPAVTSSTAPAKAPADPSLTLERVAGVHLRLVAMGADPLDAKKGAPTRYESNAFVRRRAAPSEPFEVIVREAVRDAADDVAAAIDLAGAKDERVLAALSAPERGVKVRAVAMAGERRLKAAVPQLVQLVKNEDEADQDLVLKAIGALVEIKDDRAVGALIDAGRRRSSIYLTQILFAVAALGGKEAEAYLFTVSTGHPEPEVRRTAKEALAELERRKSAPLEQGSRRE